MDTTTSLSQYKVVRLTAPVFPTTEFELAEFAKHGINLTIVDTEDPDEMIAQVADADIVTLIGTKLPARVVESMTKCRAIARMGAGTDKIAVDRATELGIVVANTPYFCVEEQADHAMAMLLSLARQLPMAQRGMSEGKLVPVREKVSRNQRMSHTTLGLVGFGRSAVHTARRARGFGMRVLATRNNPKASNAEADALGVTMTDLDTVLRESDFVSLHLPLNERTHHLINEEALNKMKPSAFLINTSRGALVDEFALFRAVKEGRIAGAGIDTHGFIDIFVEEIEPHMHPLDGLDNVIITPHVAAGSVQAGHDIRSHAIDNIVDLLNGYMPISENIVNPSVQPRITLAPNPRG